MTLPSSILPFVSVRTSLIRLLVQPCVNPVQSVGTMAAVTICIMTGFDMSAQNVSSREASLTDVASKWFGSSIFMVCQQQMSSNISVSTHRHLLIGYCTNECVHVSVKDLFSEGDRCERHEKVYAHTCKWSFFEYVLPQTPHSNSIFGRFMAA